MDAASVDALHRYVTDAKVNIDLRALKENNDVALLDNLFKPSDKELIVYRGIKQEHVVLENAMYKDLGYFSSSKDLETALFKFTGQEGNTDGALFFLRVPQNAPIIDVNSIPELNNDNLEDEIILPRGSRFIVEKHEVYSKNPLSNRDKSISYFESEYETGRIDFLNSLNVYHIKYLKDE